MAQCDICYLNLVILLKIILEFMNGVFKRKNVLMSILHNINIYFYGHVLRLGEMQAV